MSLTKRPRDDGPNDPNDPKKPTSTNTLESSSGSCKKKKLKTSKKSPSDSVVTTLEVRSINDEEDDDDDDGEFEAHLQEHNRFRRIRIDHGICTICIEGFPQYWELWEVNGKLEGSDHRDCTH